MCITQLALLKCNRACTERGGQKICPVWLASSDPLPGLHSLKYSCFAPGKGQWPQRERRHWLKQARALQICKKRLRHWASGTSMFLCPTMLVPNICKPSRLSWLSKAILWSMKELFSRQPKQRCSRMLNSWPANFRWTRFRSVAKASFARQDHSSTAQLACDHRGAVSRVDVRAGRALQVHSVCLRYAIRWGRKLGLDVGKWRAVLAGLSAIDKYLQCHGLASEHRSDLQNKAHTKIGLADINRPARSQTGNQPT